MRLSSFTNPSRPKTSAASPTLQKARTSAAGVYGSTMRLRAMAVRMMLAIIMKNITAMVRARPFSPDSSEASER